MHSLLSSTSEPGSTLLYCSLPVGKGWGGRTCRFFYCARTYHVCMTAVQVGRVESLSTVERYVVVLGYCGPTYIDLSASEHACLFFAAAKPYRMCFTHQRETHRMRDASFFFYHFLHNFELFQHNLSIFQYFDFPRQPCFRVFVCVFQVFLLRAYSSTRVGTGGALSECGGHQSDQDKRALEACRTMLTRRGLKSTGAIPCVSAACGNWMVPEGNGQRVRCSSCLTEFCAR